MNSPQTKPKLLDKLSSPYLAATLASILAIEVFLGSWLPQEPLVGKEALLTKYSNNLDLYTNLGLTDVFHSWWFCLSLILLAINLTLASFYRVFPRAKKALIWPALLSVVPKASPNVQIIEGLSLAKLIKSLKSKNWQIGETTDIALIARKGHQHRLGASITHVGILTVGFGALVSLLYGFNGSVVGVPGDRFSFQSQKSNILVEERKIYHSPLWLGESPAFELEIISSAKSQAADGELDNWHTEIQFLSPQGENLQESKLAVNTPTRFRGVDFYQADWQKVLRLNFNDTDYELKLDDLAEGKGEIAFFEITPELKIGFWRAASERYFSLIRESLNVDAQPFQLIAKLPSDQTVTVGPMKLKSYGAFPRTGLHFKHSPGDPILIMGMIVMLSGIMLSFGRKRLLWAITAGDALHIITKSDRGQAAHEEELEDLLLLLQKKSQSEQSSL